MLVLPVLLFTVQILKEQFASMYNFEACTIEGTKEYFASTLCLFIYVFNEIL